MKARFRHQVKLLLLSLVAVLALISSYEVAAVLRARHRTPEIFRRALQECRLALADLPEERLQALLRVEDPGFYQHQGVDFWTPGAGLTTLTQAMVKYLYFENFRPGFQKIEQSLIARFAVSPLVSKDDQLTVFVNTAYFGKYRDQEVRGFPQAAEAYFGKPFSDLTRREYLALVAMLIAPNSYCPRRHPERNAARVERIEALLSGRYVPTGVLDVLYHDRP